MRIDWAGSRQHQDERPGISPRQGEGSTESWPWLCDDLYLLQERVEHTLLPVPGVDTRPLVRAQIDLFHVLVGASPGGAPSGRTAPESHPALAILPGAHPVPAADPLAGALASRSPAAEPAQESRLAERRPGTPLEAYRQLYGVQEIRRCA
jgi:hypothetical protein